MLNLDSITNENNKERNENGHIFLIILTELRKLEVLNQEKQMHYLI